MPHSHQLCYAFGPYQLDLGKRVLTRAGQTIALTPKATEILVLLVLNAGQLVEKDELLKEVWPDTFVEEANLTQNIFILRRALGDERAGPKYIETVTRRGYRFVASVTVSEGSAEAETQAAPATELAVSAPPIVAVLPFVNETGEPEVEYLADGVTDNIINNLSRVSKLRVMSRSAVYRYKTKAVDARQAGKDLGVNAVLVGKVNARPAGVAINVELVDASTGWQLWGESFDSESVDLLEIQDAITRQLLATLKLKLTGDEEKSVTARYTENAEAYQSYLEGRYHWSSYTRKGIEKAIGHFRHAIELDPNYALAYAGIIDCYLRLATNYLPPEDDLPRLAPEQHGGSTELTEPDSKVRLRFEWDWKGAERELRRANELKTDYPSPHQWYAAYRTSLAILQTSLRSSDRKLAVKHVSLPQLYSGTLTPNEEVQVLCAIAREQIEVGNYEAGCLVLQSWWIPGEWPKLDGLCSQSVADLLFTTGSLAGCLSSTGRMHRGQKHAETLLSGSFSMFEHLGAKRRAAEARIELALSYYRQGMFEVTRNTLLKVLKELQPGDSELKSLGLIRLAVVERHAGHITNSLARLAEASEIIEENGPLMTGRYHHELASALVESAIAENRPDYSKRIAFHYRRALFEFIAIGHHRYAAVVENNHALVLLNLGHFKNAELHLSCARKLLEVFHDTIRLAQVDDTLARLYIATHRLGLAELAAKRAVSALEANDEEALLAEALITKGTVLFGLNRHKEARGVLEGAWRVAERAGDYEGAGRALLVLMEEMYHTLEEFERHQIAARLRVLFANTQQTSIALRVQRCFERLTENPAGE